MKHSFLYSVLLLLLICKGFSQDVIVKTDSSKIEAKILEVRASEIQYKLFNFQDGPLYVVSRNDIAYVVYANGVKEIFQIPEKIDTTPITPHISKDTIFTNPTPPKGSENVYQAKVGDYIKFNLQVGAVMNSLSANYTRRDPPLSHTSFEEYSAVSDKNVYNLNFGFNFLFGKNQYIKHVVGANYLRSTGEYNYSFGSAAGSDGLGGYKSYSEDYQYLSKIDFINVVTGLRFTILNKLCIEPLLSVNIIAQSDIRCNGYNTTKYITGGPVQSVYKEETEYVSNKKVGAERAGINSTISLCPRISYEFKIKQQKIGAYFSYNLAYQYRLPWYMAGITYYPFKEYSKSIERKIHNPNDKRNLRIIHNPKFGFDFSMVLNNGYTNTDESYSKKKPENPKEYKMGYNFGINFYHGKSSYFKHYIMASLTESKAKLLKKTYNYTYDQNYTYETVNITQYNSNVLFSNFGSGIKFIAFKNLYFDNGLALNIPIYSTNEIQYDKTYNQWDKFYTTKINTTSEPTIKSKSNELLIKKINWVFLAKIGYEFNIKQNRFGVFVGWNCNLNRGGQWHMIGISYYPFKKLR